ncbi:MAG: ribosome maturation factor RimM [bacterium]
MERDRLIDVGTITRPWGVRGEVKVLPASDIPDRFQQLEAVWVCVGSLPPERRRIESVKELKGTVVLKLEGIETPEEAEGYREAAVGVPEEDRAPLEEDAYYIYELVGLRVEDPRGRALGILSRVFQGSAQDVLEVRDPAGNRSLVPSVGAWVHEIDIEGGRVVLTIPEIEEPQTSEQDGDET